MKSILFTFLFCLGGSVSAVETPAVRVYAYDSLTSKKGWLNSVLPEFEKKCRCKVELISAGNGGQLAAKVALDRQKRQPTAHLVIGFDQHHWSEIEPFAVAPGASFKKLAFSNQEPRVRALKLPEKLIPFDYSVFAWMIDRDKLQEKDLPKKTVDWLSEAHARKLILEDPRTSTPGLAFLLHTWRLTAKPAGKPECATCFDDFWKRLQPQWLTMAPGWDGAYGLFLKEQAPAVWSYVTSEAYHRENGDSKGRYRALIFSDEESPVQIEGMAVIAGSDADTQARAESLAAFLVGEAAQQALPQKQWMLPVNAKVKLPKSFAGLPMPKKLNVDLRPASEVKRVVDRWSALF